MRIISSYHDYYDGLMAMDQDRELVYHRKVKEDVGYRFTFPVFRGLTMDHWRTSVNIEQCIIGFCGVIYPILFLRKDKEKEIVSCWSLQDVDSFVDSKCSKEVIARYKEKKHSYVCLHDFSRMSCKEFFDECEKKKAAFKHVFDEYRSPIFVVRSNSGQTTIFVNPPLEKLGFARIMPPYQAYQEIVMFLGNMAQPEKPIPEIDDETMAEIKGHGGKYSFRKPPKKK